jgi:hypothetical protein
MSNLHLYKGQLHNCIKSLFAADLGYLRPPRDEYVDLRDDGVSLEEKRAAARLFNTRPLAACRMCGGFDPQNAARHPAAEQV